MNKIKPNYHYEKLKIPFDLPEELENAIDTFLNHINYENGMSEDWLPKRNHQAIPSNSDKCLAHQKVNSFIPVINDMKKKVLISFFAFKTAFTNKIVQQHSKKR